MPTTDDTTKTVVGAMDEMQFNASLDALLDGENLNSDGSSGSNAYESMPCCSSTMQHPSIAASTTHGVLPNPTPVGSGHHGGGGPIGMRLPAISYGGSSNSAQPSYFGISTYAHVGEQQQQLQSSAQASLDASSIASSTLSGQAKTTSKSRSRKHSRDVSAVSEDEEERVRRRHDRNMREQQRSQKITEQIDHLKDLLAAANVQFKPDKYSTLVSVSDYIQQLQERSASLDVEHKKLLETISRTNEIVNNKYMSTSTGGADAPGSAQLHGSLSNDGQNDNMYLPNIDYEAVFSKCGVPLTVLSIDGRFLDCNTEFEKLTGYSRDELLPCENVSADQAHSTISRNMSLFNLLSRKDMEAVFLVMSEMLKHAPEKVAEMLRQDTTGESKSNDYWCGTVFLSRNMERKLRMNISLVRSPEGRAKFFDCSLTPVDEDTLGNS